MKTTTLRDEWTYNYLFKLNEQYKKTKYFFHCLKESSNGCGGGKLRGL